MDGSDIVAAIAIAGGTVLGAMQIYLNNDGAIMTAIIGLYCTVLGFTFGKKVVTVAVEKSASG